MQKNHPFHHPLYGDERNPQILRMAQDVHAFAAPLPPFHPQPGEILFGKTWSLASENRAWRHCLGDFADFLGRMGCARAGQAAGKDVARLLLRRQAAPAGAAEIDISPAGIEIACADIRGAWRSIVRLEHEMAWRHAPILPAGRIVLPPPAPERITTSLFAAGLEDPADPHAYTDPYLRSMAHYGYDGFFIYINLWDYIHSRVLPEMNAPQAKRQVAALAALAARAESAGLKIYLLPAAPGVPADHPVLQAHPAVAGGTVTAARKHALCPSAPATRAFYAEQLARLCSIRPALGGVIFIIGGEGFRHCYSTPNPRADRVTNCSRCASRGPARALAPMLNAISAAIRQAAPGTRAVYWPYSSIIWQKQSHGAYRWEEDLALIKQLDRQAVWLMEIDKDAPTAIPGVGATQVYDYSIQYIGPSPKFNLEQAAARRRGLAIAVKTETTQSIELFALPYIPVMHRWAARREAIRRTGAELIMDTWRLNGFWQAPSVELVYWQSEPQNYATPDALYRVACRLYGARAAAHVLRAWSDFSKAWETSHARYGTYWDGPLVLGPAHPFDIGTAFLSRSFYSPAFYHPSPALREHGSADALQNPWRLRPKFHLMPGRWAKARRRDFGRAAAGWRRGMLQLRQALRQTPRPIYPRARNDLEMAEMVGIFLEADLAFNTFAWHRDMLNHTHVTSPAYRRRLLAIETILKDDLIRSRRGREIAERQPFIGWGYTFGARFNPAMISEKITKTEELLSKVRTCIADTTALLV